MLTHDARRCRLRLPDEYILRRHYFAIFFADYAAPLRCAADI